jgi:hypothetical protein
MLKTKIVPVYSAEVFKNHSPAMIVLHAAIGTKGIVQALQVISGRASLHKATLDAVRQRTFRHCLLNNRPVEVETTIKFVIPPRR